jgi:putative peptidoglycan lipid II flippase
VGLNLGLNLLFIGPLRSLGLGHLGLALATSLTSMTNLAQLAVALRRRIGPLEGGRMLGTLIRVSIASGIAVLPMAIALLVMGERWHHGFARAGAMVVAGLVVSAGLGWGALKLARVAELATFESLVATLARRFTGRS